MSQKAVGKGYDIKSFELNGKSRFIEVKATIRAGPLFFMSGNEWNVAAQLKKSYWVYRVVRALDQPSISILLQDPIGAERSGQIKRTADGWIVTLL